MAGGEVGFLSKDVGVLGGLLGVFDLADALALGCVGDVFGLLAAQVAGGEIRAEGLVVERDRAARAGGE